MTFMDPYFTFCSTGAPVFPDTERYLQGWSDGHL